MEAKLQTRSLIAVVVVAAAVVVEAPLINVITAKFKRKSKKPKALVIMIDTSAALVAAKRSRKEDTDDMRSVALKTPKRTWLLLSSLLRKLRPTSLQWLKHLPRKKRRTKA